MVIACWLSGCNPAKTRDARSVSATPVLQVLSLTSEKQARFELDFLTSFGLRNHVETQYVPSLDSVNVRLSMYRKLLGAHSSQPDMLALDVVWPAILAPDLYDLRPYLTERHSYPPELLASYSVNGHLLALPTIADVGVLYYRPELLAKYGFHDPPATWDELEVMAKRIQTGERKGGNGATENKDFWGYTWQGGNFEGLTCNALEWQASSGAGVFIEPAGTVHVNSPRFIAALRRATNWIGTISPPGEFVYWEPDSENLWNAGQVAFMRDWTSSYGAIKEKPGNDYKHFGVVPLPGGPGGQRGTLGGQGMAVSRYAANRDLAVKALFEMTDDDHALQRRRLVGGLPTRPSPENSSPDAGDALGAVSSQALRGLVARPSAIAGEKYAAVSQEYAHAINLVLRRKVEPEQAMADLEKKLMQITGLPAQHD